MNKLAKKTQASSVTTRPTSATICQSQEAEFKVKALRSQLNYMLVENDNLKDEVESLKQVLEEA